MPDSLIKQQYQSLHKLLSQYRLPEPPSNLVQQTLNFSNDVLGVAKKHPELIFAQIHLYKTSLPYSYNLIFSTCLLTALISTRNRFNETTTQQLLCAAISLFAFEQSTLNGSPTGNADQEYKSDSSGSIKRSFGRILTQYQQGVWLRGFRQVQWLNKDLMRHMRALSGSNVDVVCVAMAARLALLINGEKGNKKLGFQAAIHHLLQYTSSAEAPLLAPLMEFPSMTPPGAYIMLDDGALGMVIGVCDTSVVCYPQSTSGQQSKHTAHFKVPRSRIKRVYPAQKMKQFSQLNTWWGKDWQALKQDSKLAILSPFTQSYKMSRPPATLTAIQGQLNKPVQDVKALSQAIAREPAFAQHLRHTASQSSREKLPSKDIQHGLMMHGFERSGSIIMQQALLSRLNQHYFPLQRYFINFAQLRGHVAASIAKAADIGIPEQACTLSYFACVGLFTHPQLKIQLKWQPLNACAYDIRSLIRCVKPEQLRSHSISMAESWQQPRHEIVALGNYHDVHYIDAQRSSISVKLAALLGISLMITRELYFASAQRCALSQVYWQNALNVLQISEEDVQSISQNAFSVCHSYSPV